LSKTAIVGVFLANAKTWLMCHDKKSLLGYMLSMSRPFFFKVTILNAAQGRYFACKIFFFLKYATPLK
jgi:hypothetical protein